MALQDHLLASYMAHTYIWNMHVSCNYHVPCVVAMRAAHVK